VLQRSISVQMPFFYYKIRSSGNVNWVRHICCMCVCLFACKRGRMESFDTSECCWNLITLNIVWISSFPEQQSLCGESTLVILELRKSIVEDSWRTLFSCVPIDSRGQQSVDQIEVNNANGIEFCGKQFLPYQFRLEVYFFFPHTWHQGTSLHAHFTENTSSSFPK